jgi:hypothetical protein
VIGVLAMGAAFLAYLTWTFTPRRVATVSDANAPRVRGRGAAGERLFYQIVERRDTPEVVYDVYLSTIEAPPQDERGALVLRTVEWPIPARVLRIDAKTVEVEMDRPPRVRIPIDPMPLGMVYLERGKAIEP